MGTKTLAIVFADISGSTRLYDSLGDSTARELVAQCLTLMSDQTSKYQGVVIKTIGDEIMCTFGTADEAVEAVMGMQESITEDLPRMHPYMPASLKIRVGLHFGPAILEHGDVFGDAVNVAARMTDFAKGGQIICTQETIEALTPALRASSRHLDRLQVKGKAADIDIFEVVWQPDDMTRIATDLVKSRGFKGNLRLRYNGEVLTLDHRSGVVILGRGKNVDMVVNDSMISREHARIETRRGKFFLIDQSTNGTYVLGVEGPSYIRREEMLLSGRGKITLGRELGKATEVVCFDCEPVEKPSCGTIRR